MKFQHYRSVGLAALGSALVLLSADNVNASIYEAVGCSAAAISDGQCNGINNNADCGK